MFGNPILLQYRSPSAWWAFRAPQMGGIFFGGAKQRACCPIRRSRSCSRTDYPPRWRPARRGELRWAQGYIPSATEAPPDQSGYRRENVIVIPRTPARVETAPVSLSG